MKTLFTSLVLSLILGAVAVAQDAPAQDAPIHEPPIEDIPLPDFPEVKAADPEIIDQPDYSRLTPGAERTARLDALFVRLKDMEDEERANLIAEEIWAIWLDSGSDTVNLILRRGTAAQKRGDRDLARQMYAQVTLLEPTYAEGWARSGRLALEEDDLNAAMVEVTQALIYEPRHFYALWTLGNIFERLGRTDEAFETYSEAHKLYPALKAVKDQRDKLQKEIEGDVL